MTRSKILFVVLLSGILFAAGTEAGRAQLENGSAAAQAAFAEMGSLPSPLLLPMKEGSVRIAVMGDTGSGKPAQYDVGRMMKTYHAAFPYDTVLMVGDNIYGADTAADMKLKFQDVYQALIDQRVKFYAALGNHDSPNQRFYEYFNMGGQEYYWFEKGGVSFYALNSTYMDKKQIEWLTTKLASDKNKWKIAYLHHPPFSSGGFHGSSKGLRKLVHPLFVQYKLPVVFTGHDHFYERVKPQDGVNYFVTGSGGQLRKGNVRDSSKMTAAHFDTDMAFLMFEIADDQMHFQVISRTGKTVDSGVIKGFGD